MILFVDIEGILVQQCSRKADTTFRHIILNERNFAWIKSQNFERIFVVTNQKGIGEEGWLDEKLFDFQIGYVARALKLYTNTKVDVRYYPYERPNGFLIKDILEEFNIKKNNAIILGNKKNHKEDAVFSGLKYIDIKEFKDEN
jgi:histidinol phosphatase-like enzyme